MYLLVATNAILLHSYPNHLLTIAMRYLAAYFFLLFGSSTLTAQYYFEGVVDSTTAEAKVYLSIVDNYRKMSGVYTEQILQRATPDGAGKFSFYGNNLSSENRMYRIHVDTCPDTEQGYAHFNGHCSNSEEILFIANNKDTIQLPFSFDSQLFCKIIASNEKADALLRVDSLVNDMRYDFATYRSQANKQLNLDTWFKRLQTFGEDLNEPLAELYIYALASDRKSELYAYYLDDLASNGYYQDLQQRLNNQYANTTYAEQFETELNADKFIVAQRKEHLPWWSSLIAIIAFASLAVNIYLIRERKKKKAIASNAMNSLSPQEKRIYELIVADKTNKQIAEEIFVSVSTVKTHINNLYKKLGVNSREEAKKTYVK